MPRNDLKAYTGLEMRLEADLPWHAPGRSRDADGEVVPFDTTKSRLGTLCKAGHDYHHTGKSLRANNKAGYCLACHAAAKHREREHKRQQEVRT